MATPIKSAALLLRKHLSPNKLSPRHFLSTPTRFESKGIYSGAHLKNHSITIKVDHIDEENSFLLNTPNKNELLKSGLEKNNLFAFIGKGTFGTVIKAKYRDKIVAAKLIRIENSKASIYEKNAFGLDHCNIVQLYDVIVSDKRALVLMEYCRDSKNLQDVLNIGKICYEKMLSYCRNVADGLAYCHRNNILHLDIKPKNILLCCNDICKICDFGNSYNEVNTSAPFKFQGTISYTAPEILKGNLPSSKADIYSLGVVIWQLNTCESPYGFLDNEVVIYKVVKFNLRPDVSSIDKNLGKLCDLCWHENSNMRPNASQVSLALSKCVE